MTDLEKDKILLLADSIGKMVRELQSIKRLLKEIADASQTEQIKTLDYCDICNHKGCDNCIKTYKTPDGRAAVFYYDRNGVGKITLESMNMLMGELIAYQQCIQSRSFWDSKHCDGCRFYDNCPFNPQEDEDEPQTGRSE